METKSSGNYLSLPEHGALMYIWDEWNSWVAGETTFDFHDILNCFILFVYILKSVLFILMPSMKTILDQPTGWVFVL